METIDLSDTQSLPPTQSQTQSQSQSQNGSQLLTPLSEDETDPWGELIFFSVTQKRLGMRLVKYDLQKIRSYGQLVICII